MIEIRFVILMEYISKGKNQLIMIQSIKINYLKYFFVLPVVSIFILLPKSGISQSYKNYLLKANFGMGLSSHPSELARFPLPFTDAAIIPKNLESKVGYQFSIMGLKELNKLFSFGISANYSKFGFIEHGDFISFWSNSTRPYFYLREFELYGFGLIAGINIVEKGFSKFSTYLGFRYEGFISTTGVYLAEEYDRNKFATEILLEYGHKLTKRTHLTLGLNSLINLREFFDYFGFQPIRYGLLIGVEYEFD